MLLSLWMPSLLEAGASTECCHHALWAEHPLCCLQGGPAAHDAVGRQLLQALKPYRKEGAPEREAQACFTLLRCASQGACPIY